MSKYKHNSNEFSFRDKWSHDHLIESMPYLNIKNIKTFERCWFNCHNLKHFPPHMFDNLTGKMETNCFHNTWGWTNLTYQSVENIIVSLNKAKIYPNHNKQHIVVDYNIYDPVQILPNAIMNEIRSLNKKRWSIIINGDFIN